MKRIVIAFALISAVAVHAQDNAWMNGKWNIHTEMYGRSSDTPCVFTQRGSDLTGICESPAGSMKVAGKVDGSKVSWSYTAGYGGVQITMTTSGTLNGGKITGRVTASAGGMDAPVTATRMN